MANPQQQLFGLLIPGQQVRTDFVPADPAGAKFTLTLTFTLPNENPTSIADVVFFLLPGAVLPPNFGAVLYWQVSNTSSNAGFEMFGAVTSNRPSGVLRTGWAQHESVLAACSAPVVTITLGVSIEPIENIQNLDISTRGVEDRANVAKKIALNLFNFLQSFDFMSQGDGTITVPNNVFDRWMQRFEAKYKMDPNFFMKSSSS
mmetsp:Transcript_30694/g.45435  ORF Transcript_30694/g.45435 Transcript_30694/m.45435 type:complete len:203 (+) Transcript_30694:110-718(+)|eukprot:CAMPEP_0195526016 /NCGR_PEP_ID=MMETSP0794_2-20130614/26817_1 /TAXON_ID=515487 /ORGANISM="Stephanopyxis turris, Strain CCMP 815" /LENGTH=202 /DNA_ID=CAMNT_0040656615 /DNA_START=108 /DNA_END=716 /DNA_ORIENTATION=-